MSKKTVKDIDLKEKKVLVRCDFNVPMDENKKITDNRRIEIGRASCRERV